MNGVVVTLLIILNISSIYCQKYYKNPIEISPYYSIGVSFSKLSNKTDFRFSSPPELNAFNYGLKFERRINKKDSSFYMNTCISSGNLSISSYYFLRSGKRGEGYGITVIPNYTILSFGIKKEFNPKKKKLNLNLETGFKIFFLNSSEHEDYYRISQTIDTPIYMEYKYISSKNVFPIPYVAFGLSYKIKKFKIGIQFWGQNAFNSIYVYDYNVKYGSSLFNSKAISRGLGFGSNVYIKLFTF